MTVSEFIGRLLGEERVEGIEGWDVTLAAPWASEGPAWVFFGCILLVALSFGLVLAPPLAAEDGDEMVDSRTRRLLEKVAKDLASQGRSEEMRTALDVLERLGHPASAMKRLRKACDRSFSRSKPSASKALTSWLMYQPPSAA